MINKISPLAPKILKSMKSISGVNIYTYCANLSNYNRLDVLLFIFDFNEEIYGEYATVIFKQKCRDEKKFESFDELKKQIKKDVKKSRLFFQNNIS